MLTLVKNLKNMKTEHILFVQHYLLTGDRNKAYKAVYPKATGIALKTAARRLINRPHIQTYLQQNTTNVAESTALY